MTAMIDALPPLPVAAITLNDPPLPSLEPTDIAMLPFEPEADEDDGNDQHSSPTSCGQVPCHHVEHPSTAITRANQDIDSVEWLVRIAGA